MNLPSFYDPKDIGTLRHINIPEVLEAANKIKTRPASKDEQRTLLLLVDPQVDFIHEDGTLSVPGAVDDTRRTIEWMYRNLESITDIAVSLDSHFSRQIFYPGWWADANGNHPSAMTPISAEDVDAGRWTPTVEPEWSRFYVHELGRRAKKVLMIWPYHTMIGTLGHSITPALYEAITYHNEVRHSEVTHLVKGRIAKTEFYSIFEPEVKAPDEPDGTLNSAFLDRMAGYDRIYVAGQAKSHCVLETIVSIANYGGFQPGILDKVYLLDDCTSAVVHPEIDFNAMADERLAQYPNLKRVTSEDEVQ